MQIFESHHASKQIDGTRILNDISIRFLQGERIAITGSNGSGKSSLLKLIGGIYEATSGQIWRTKMKVGYVPEHFPENIRFKTVDYLLTMGMIAGKSKEEIVNRTTYFSEVFAIADFLNTPLKKCSKGTKQKVGIIQAMLKKPDLLLLDEPLTGLDDNAQMELLHQLHTLPRDITILFTAHDQLLIEEVAERVIVVDRGSIISDSSKIIKEKRRMIKVNLPSKEIMDEIPFVQHKIVGNNCVEIIIPANESDKLLMKLLERGCSVVELIEKR